MKPLALSFQKNSSNKQTGLVYAFSPRNHEREDGTTGELNFASGSRSMRSNVQWFLRSIGMNKEEVFLVRQVHGDVVYDFKDASVSFTQVADVPADAIITRLVGQPIGVLTADCIPIVVYDSRLHVTGVIHAGRKGTALGIVSKTIKAMQKIYGSNPHDILAEMGPGIGGCCYEVDKACIEPFKKFYPDWSKLALASSSGKFMLDLFSANAENAKLAGIEPKNISHTGFCTSCQVKRFFSYRREGTTGRMLTVAMLNPE